MFPAQRRTCWFVLVKTGLALTACDPFLTNFNPCSYIIPPSSDTLPHNGFGSTDVVGFEQQTGGPALLPYWNAGWRKKSLHCLPQVASLDCLFSCQLVLQGLSAGLLEQQSSVLDSTDAGSRLMRSQVWREVLSLTNVV